MGIRAWLLYGARFSLLASPLIVLALAPLPDPLDIASAQVLHGVALVAALSYMTRAARTGDAAMRRPRRLLAAALACTVAANVSVLALLLAGIAVTTPSLVDAVSLLWIPLAGAGVWLLPGRDRGRASSLRIAADAAVISSSVLVLSWTLVLGPMSRVDGWGAAERLVQLAYPIGDLVLVALVLSLLQRVRPDLRRMFIWAAGGLVVVAVADSASMRSAAVNGGLRFSWADVALQLGLVLVVVSTRVQADGSTDEVTDSWVERYLPPGLAMLAVPIAIWDAADEAALRFGSAAPARALVLALILRQVLYTHELNRVLRQQRTTAAQDALTGIANRAVLMARLSAVLAVPDREPALLLLVDLDGFKEVNDNYGHDYGDHVLCGFARSLEQRAGEALVARLGGDEFAVLLLGAAQVERGQALAAELGSWRQVSGRDGGVPLLASVGVTSLEQDDQPVDVLRRADLAMYDAKRRRALPRVTVYSDSLGQHVHRRNLLAADIAGAAVRGELHLAYQPLVQLSDDSVAGAEALLRWTHPRFGAVEPQEFIALAEEGGHIGALGGWVLDQAVAQLAQWDAAGLRLPQLFVNVSTRQFDATLPVAVDEVLSRYGVDRRRLVLEVTESQAADLAGNAAAAALRARGVRIALDDFGAGYSTFGQLARLPADVLKIDRAFVADLGSEAGLLIIEAITALAASLGMRTVVEGLEDAEQAAAARMTGVDLGQGYHFSRPLPAAGLAALLTQPAAPRALPRQRGSRQPGRPAGDLDPTAGSSGSLPAAWGRGAT